MHHVGTNQDRASRAFRERVWLELQAKHPVVRELFRIMLQLGKFTAADIVDAMDAQQIAALRRFVRDASRLPCRWLGMSDFSMLAELRLACDAEAVRTCT